MITKNREIKFRAFNKRDKRMYQVTGITCSPTLSAWIVNTEEHDELIVSGESGEIMQYTGLKDRNGKEIYEGDIISYMQDEDCPKEVYYKDGAFWPIVSFGTETAVVVLGNIYENPELLV